jgi:rod shape determining protein RodA
VVRNEARRWFNFGIFEVQPGEVAKILLSIFFAKFIADRDGHHSYISTVLISFALLVPCVALILRQPNYSTAITIVIIWAAIIFVGGVDRQYLIFAVAATILFVVFLTQFSDLLPDYVQRRITLFLDPSSVSEAGRYQQTQALTALGSGGMLGQGFLQGPQSQLRYFPVRHTDFIFSVIGEELGFVGAMIFLVLLLLVIIRSLRAAVISTDIFGRLMCTGIAAALFLQTYTNIAMQVGLAPITGIVLPFISYGRTSLLIVMLSIGMVESVAMRHKKLEFGREVA